MPRARVDGIEIEYETFGDRSSRPLLLVMGLGAQLLHWHEGLCEALAGRGQFVIRFDNRDAGLSSRFEHLGLPDLTAMRPGAAPPYSLDDMARDALGVLDALGIASAHVCGASMGGMIAQTLAYGHPQRVRSLVSIMSTTGDPSLPGGKPEAIAALMAPPARERAANIEQSVMRMRTMASPLAFDEARAREVAIRAYDRAYYPQGGTRQLAAILAHGNRAERLAAVRVPTLVIHGVDDPLVPVEGGRHTAQCIDGAALLELERMGHDLPEPHWPRLADEIAAHTERAEGAGVAR